MENLKNVAPLEDFNWDAYENGEATTSMSHDELEKAYDNTLNKVNDHEVVDGTVISIDKRNVVVNIGYKSDGIIPLNEFRYNPDLKVGDTVEVYIENQEDKKGQLILSHKKARAARSWDRINAALENDEIIKGYIIRHRSLPAGFSNRREAHPRLRCIRRQDHGIQGCQDQPGIQECRCFAQGSH